MKLSIKINKYSPLSTLLSLSRCFLYHFLRAQESHSLYLADFSQPTKSIFGSILFKFKNRKLPPFLRGAIMNITIEKVK